MSRSEAHTADPARVGRLRSLSTRDAHCGASGYESMDVEPA
jgi:hypothetical protein